MVTKVITLTDPRYANDPRMWEAVEREKQNIVSHGTWNPDRIEEWADVRQRDPLAELIRAHVIVGLKNAEDPNSAVFKCRVVVNGGNVQDVWGQQVVPADLYTMPISFGTARAIGGLALAQEERVGLRRNPGADGPSH